MTNPPNPLRPRLATIMEKALAPARAIPAPDQARRMMLFLFMLWADLTVLLISLTIYLVSVGYVPMPACLHLVMLVAALILSYFRDPRAGLVVFVPGAVGIQIVGAYYYDMTSLLYAVLYFLVISVLLRGRAQNIYFAVLFGAVLVVGLATVNSPRHSAISHDDAVIFSLWGILVVFGITKLFDVDLRQIAAQNRRLKDAETHLAGSQRAAHIGTWELDLPSLTMRWSDECYRLVGFEVGQPARPSHEDVLRLVHPDDAKAWWAGLDRMRFQRLPADAEIRIIRASDRAIRWIWVHGEVEMGPDGSVARCFGTIFDLTQLRDTEAALRERVNFIERAMAIMPSTVFVYDLQTWLPTYMNRSIEALTGYTPEAIIEQGQAMIDKLFRPEAQVGLFSFLNRMQTATNQLVSSEVAIWHQNGEKHWLLVQATPFLLNEDGTPRSMIGTATDITGLKRAEEAMIVSEGRSEAMLRAFPDMAFHLDRDGVFLEMRDSVNELPIEPGQLVGRNLFDVLPPHMMEMVRSTFEAARITCQVQTLAYERADTGSGRQWYEARFVPQAQGDTFVFVRNITALKQLQMAQHELTNRLQKANRNLTEFAYVLSHDLKAPLRGMISLMDWLKRDYENALDEEGASMLNLLQGRATRMASMIDGILEYSRLEHSVDRLALVDFGTLVGELVELMVAGKAATRIESQMPIIRAEPTQMRQVFQNLLDNAVKYNDKAQPEIRIGCEERTSEWEFWVADNGPGIESRHFERIFQIFQTLAPRDERDSTGLGLAIVKRIVEMYGGQVWLTSTFGQGSTFYFTLPKSESD